MAALNIQVGLTFLGWTLLSQDQDQDQHGACALKDAEAGNFTNHTGTEP